MSTIPPKSNITNRIFDIVFYTIFDKLFLLSVCGMFKYKRRQPQYPTAYFKPCKFSGFVPVIVISQILAFLLKAHHQKRELMSERCPQIFCLFLWLSIFLKRFLFLDSAHPIWASSMRSMPYKITKSLFELPKPCLVQKLVVE